MSPSVLVLFGHGARDPEWAQPLELVRAAIKLRQPQRRVELAFLEFITPTLEECIAKLVGERANEPKLSVLIIPMFIAQSGHLKRDVPPRIKQLRLMYPKLEINIAEVIGEVPGVVAAVADFACSR